mgnify:CR=1 FL=1
MPKHSVDQWNQDEDIQISNARGFSMLQKLPKLLKKTYPDLRPFRFGFFVEEDLPDRYTDGWEHLTTDDFPQEDIDSLNTALSNKGAWTEKSTEEKTIGDLTSRVKLRFNIQTDPRGWVKYKKNFIMIQPEDYFMKRRRKLNEISEAQFKGNVLRDDGAKPADGFTGAKATHEETTGPVGAVRRGRPRSK